MGKFFPDARISAIHGQMHRSGDRFIIAMFHPAAALHQSKLKPTILADFAKLPALLEEARKLLNANAPARQPMPDETDENPQQLSLF